MNRPCSSRQITRPLGRCDSGADWAEWPRNVLTQRLWLIVILAPITASAAAHIAVAVPPAWTHFSIDSRLPGESWGTAGIPLADLDGDGDLDAALSRRDAQVFVWYERVSDAKWERHVVSEDPDLQMGLGAATLDLNNDTWPDLIFSHVWFENPGCLRVRPDANWPAHPLAGGGHDILTAELNGDRREDLVIFDGDSLAWFDTADSLRRHPIADNVGHHGGVTPQGVGDLDSDGDPDLVIAGVWWENRDGRASAWKRHPWPHRPIPGASYGTSIRSWVADVDADGWQDIVYSDCDTGYGHVHWVRNLGRGRQWHHQQLPDPPFSAGSVAGTGSFHSLAVADFDGDGNLDIFAGEQEDPDTYMTSDGKLPMKPQGLKERGVIWMSSGGARPDFLPHVIQEDNPGWHDVSVGDVDGDGDPDLVSKIWNKDGAHYHADYWRNDGPRSP